MQRPPLALLPPTSLMVASSALARATPRRLRLPQRPLPRHHQRPRCWLRPCKREACRQEVTSKQLKGQDRKDQMQLCMAQARVDCLKQAVDQKIDGPQRKEFVKTCVAG